MLAHSERVNSLATIQLWLDLARSRPRTLLSHGAKPQAPDRSEEPLILRQPDEPLPLTPLCRDRADALRCPSSFHTIARRSLRARSHLRPPRLLTRPCRRGSLSRATRAPSVVRSAMRVAVRAFPSRACARVEWAWPVYGIRFRAGACSRCSPDRLPFEERIVDCSLDPVSPVSSAAEARSRARPAWDASGGDPGPFDRYLQPTRFVFQRRARPSRCVPNRVAHAIREPPVLRRWPASAVRALLFSRIACRGIYSASRRTACL